MSIEDSLNMALVSDDSDDEDIDATLGISKTVGGATTMEIPQVLSMADFEELKKKTLSLVDPEWKRSRNKELLSKMLALESPSITNQMVEFLAQEEICDLLLNYVTQCEGTLKRPTLQDEATPELKMAHKVTILLTADDPSDGLKMLLSRRAAFIMKLILDIFDEKSAGSFYHAFRIVDLLARFFPLEVLTALMSDGNLPAHIIGMLRYVGCPPVAELIAMLVSLSPVARETELYQNCEQARVEFLAELQEMNFLSMIVDAIVEPESNCSATDELSMEVHSQFACQLFQDLLEKLSMEYVGEALLEPFVQRSGQLKRVLNTVTDPNARGFVRRNCSKLLDVVLRQASEPEVLNIFACATQMGQPKVVPNRLYPLREAIIEQLSSNFERLVNLVLTFEPTKEDLGASSGLEMGGGEDGRQNFIYPTHTITSPFSTLRINFIDLVALIVESDEDVTGKVPKALWCQLLLWVRQYPQNNVFHSIFYRLIFSLLKQQRPEAQRVLFAQAGFVDFIVDTFLPLSCDLPGPASTLREDTVDWKTPPKGAPQDHVDRFVLRGLILNCANACRLQALTQSPSSYLRSFLANNTKWQEFQPLLRGASEPQKSFGAGISVQDGNSRGFAHSAGTLSDMMGPIDDSSNMDGDGDGRDGLDLGGHFAHNLGFFEVSTWDELPHDDDESEDEVGDDQLEGTIAGAGTPRGLEDGDTTPHSNNGEGDSTSSRERDSFGSPISGDRDSLGDRKNRLSGSGPGINFNRSPMSQTMFVPRDLEDDESDVVDGILGPSSPAAQRIIEAAGSPSSPDKRSPGAGTTLDIVASSPEGGSFLAQQAEDMEHGAGADEDEGNSKGDTDNADKVDTNDLISDDDNDPKEDDTDVAVRILNITADGEGVGEADLDGSDPEDVAGLARV